MNLILTDLANLTSYLIPVVPRDTKISIGNVNEIQDTLTGRMQVIGNAALRTISWSSILPVNKNYQFVPFGVYPNGFVYVEFIETMRRLKLPIRIIGTSNKKLPMYNFLATIDSFSWEMDKVGDIKYSITLTEFPEKFIDFVNRTKEAFKYTKKYITGQQKQNALKQYGLIK